MHVRSIQHVKEMDDDVEFATDMEEPVCEGSEEQTTNKKDIHTELRLFTLDFSESSQETTVGWIIVLNSF